MFKNAKTNIACLNIFTHVIITINLLFLVCTTTINIVSADQDQYDDFHKAVHEITTVTIGANFLILSIEFAITGFLILRRLRKYFPEFYLENKWLLIWATIGLSMPLMIRGVFDGLRGISHIDKHVQEKQAFYNSLLFFLGDVVPIAF